MAGASAAVTAAGLAACGVDGAGGGDAGGGDAGGGTAPPTSTVTEVPAAPPTSPAPVAATGGPGLVPGGPAAAVAHGPRDRPQVALTFHLGPHLARDDLRLAHQLLADARRLGAPITVFAVGQWLAQHADLVPLILQDGNELDNHTFTHPTLPGLPAGRVAAEITGCRDVLARLAPTEGRYFRPSGTSSATPLILAEAGAAGYRTVVDFDVDPLDYADPGADAVVGRAKAGIRPGSIVSLHFGHPGTVAALPRIIGNLRAGGLTPVLLRDLLA
jgi:peptidoglycan/xylan/chitin deacetylase (PgdA/CDA1 family)